MFYYEVIAQFAKADAPSFETEGYEALLLDAKDYFNVKSRVASNPKEITELQIVDDETIRIVFCSNESINIAQASRSLRVFIMYLLDETHPVNFSDLVCGKRLFRMLATECVTNTGKKMNEKITKKILDLDEFEKLDMESKLIQIYKVLLENIREGDY